MGNNKKIITKLILFVIFIACTVVVMNRSVITGSLKAISNKRNEGTNVYRVSYVSNGGKWTSGSDFENGYIDYSYGELIDEPTDSDITHNGCTLEGWYTDSNYTNKWDFSTGTVDQNMTLYANWERNIYTVEFREIYDDYTGEDVVLDSVEVPYGYTLILDGEASDETLTFKYNGPELSTTNFKNWISSTGTYTITQDTVFFARYENENVYVLNVNYLFQNGAVASHNKVTTLIEGGTYNIDTPVIRGYTPSTNNINGVLNQTSVAAFQADDETGNADNVEVKKVDDTTYYVTYFVLFTPNQTTYKVNHYLQKVDLSGYDLQESIEYDETIIDGNSKTVYVGDKINPILNTYEGFTHNTEKSDITGKALPDGESELNQYYDRNTYYIYAANTGDTYFDPIPVVYGANINFNETATRRGYTFNGWTWSYTLGGEAIASLSTMPARDLYVSANWTATTTTYIFSYYEEYANSDAYVNIGNIEQNGNTGTNLSTLNLNTAIQNGFRSLESEYTYFTYNQTKTLEENNNFDVVISGDGTTKINIYYRRNRYTILFDLNDSRATTKAILTMNGNDYTTATTQYSFVAKYNQDISTLWPKATDFTQKPSSGNFYGWKRNGASNTYASMRNNLTLDMLSSTTDGSSTTYQANYITGGSTVHLYYMAESFDQTSPVTETRRNYQGVYYDSIPEFEQTVITNTTGFSAKELANLTKVGNENSTSGSGNNRVYTYYFYYSRNTLNLTFWNVIENDTNLSTSLPYGSDLSSYASSVPNEYPIVTPGEGEWTFDQWYQDPDCTIPMDFDTELETNLTLYAKWIPPQYNITFNVNEGDWNDLSSTYTDNGDGTYSYSVDEATVLTPPTEPTRYGYTFDGWYYDAEIDGVQRNIRYIFDESQKVYNDLSLEAHWSNSLYVKYRVKYIKGQKDINGDLITDINQYSNYETVLDDKVVTNVLFDTTVTEQAANVIHAGEEIYYLADSQFKTLKLDAEDEEDNIIYFFYDSSDEAYYTVYYLRYNNKEYDRSETPDPTEYLAQPKTITLKTAADGTLVSERAETIFGYTVRDNWYQELQLIANQDHNKMFFYYDNNSEYGDYSVNIYLMDSGTEIYGNTPAYIYSESGIVGSTIFTSNYLGKEYIPTIVWDTYKLDNMYSDTYIIISDGEDVITDLNIYLKLKDHTITYQLDGGTWTDLSNNYTHNENNSAYYESVRNGNACTEPTDPTKAGYNFLGWFDEDDNEFDFSTTITSDLTLIAKWAPRTDLTYTVKYIDQFRNTEIQAEKVVPNNTIGSVIHISDEIVEIAGYTYQGGYSGELTIDADESLNVITLYYKLNSDVPYTVNHWGQKVGGDPSIHDEVNYTLRDTDSLDGETNIQVTPETKTYTGFTSPSTQTVTIAGDGSTEVNYYYTRNSYDVTLDKDNGIATVTGAGSYLYEAEVTLTAEVKDGYTWKEWTGDKPSSDQTYIFTMPADNVVNKANTTINTYSITYTLNDGTLAVDNPTSYTVETDSFTLNNPSKTGYTFIGWTGSNGTTPNVSVTIPKGTTGNLEYVANYNANTDTAYVVKHWTQNITGDASIHDEVNYTIKDTDDLQGTTDTQVTPAVKSYTGFTSPATQTVTIAADGSTVVDYYYTRNSYNVTLDKDDGISTLTGAGSYLYEAEVTITAEVKDGYTWKDWTGSKASSDQTYIFTMPAGNVENKANTTINTYSITYTLNDGEVELDNPTSYTVETDTFTLNNPSKTGYTFIGWTGSNGTTPQINVTIPKGTTGNLEYVANYNPITYTVEYDGNGATGGNTEPSTHIYDEAKNLTPNGYERKYTITYDYNYDEKENTTKTVAYTFAVWSDGRTRRLYNDEESVINLISTNNGTKTIYAIWDEASDTNLPTRTGYKFEGWYDNEETTGNRLDTNGEYTPTADITLYAKWSVDDSQEKELKYTLKYYKDNVLAETYGYTKTVQVLEPDTLEVSKSEINTTDKYVGYDFVRTDPATIPDVINHNSTIKVYYEIKDYLTYTVKYIDVDTNEEIKTAKPVGNQTYNTVVNTSTEVIDIDGYNFDHPEVASIMISTNESANIINLYYKKAQYDYTIEYYYDNVIDNTKTDTFQATYKDKISTYQAKAIDGYTLDKVEPAELEIGYVAANNVMRVYYKKAKFNYTVEYYYDNVIDSSKTETKQATFKDTISTYTSKNITGYALNNVANLPLTISSNEANNIIKVYYVRAPYSYTVNYYFNNVIRSDLSETYAALFNDSINTYDDKVEVGYKLDRVETLPLVVSENNDANVLSVYYITDPDQTKELKYTIKYYKDGVEFNSDDYTKTVQVLENDIIEVDKTKINTTNKYDGYYFMNTDPSTIPDEVTTGTIIKVNYTIRNDLSYTVEYWDKEENETIKTSKVVDNQTFNSEILSTSEKIDIDGYDYDSVSADSITIKTDNSLNIIKFYYTKRTNLEYKVNYLLKDSDDDDSNNEVIHSQKVQGNMIFKSVVTSSNEVIDIDGYNYDSVNVGSITISANVEQNIINIFYTKRTDLKYTVNYLEKDSDDDDSNNKVLMTQKVQENQTFGTIINSANEVIAIAGYNYLAPSVNSISVKTEEALNVITLYYTPRTDLSYKVNYLLKDSDDDDSNNTVLHASKTVSNQSYLAEINPTDEEVFVTGYKVASYSSNPLIIGLGENVLTIYYSKDESQTDTIDYTIQYYKDGVIVPADTENISSTIYILDKITFTPNVNKYEGYNYDSVNSIIPEYVTDGAVIKVYYTSRTDLSYTVQYLQKETSDVLHSAKVYGNQTYGDSIVSANEVISIDGYNYDSSNVPNLVIGTNENENIIKLYYTKRTDLSYVVNYLELSTNKVLHSQKVYNNIIFDSEINSADEIISINGYKYNSVNSNSIKIKTNVSQNVINIYYTKVTGLAYTVRYLDKSSNEEIATAKVVDNQTFEDEILTSDEIVSIDGYTYDSTNVDKLIIGTNNTENVINIYYNKRNDLSYSVKYFDKDTNTQIESPKVVNNQVFNTQIIATSEIKDINGYNFDHLNVDKLSIGTGQNVIIVYYSKVTGLSYKVNYLLLDNDEDDSNNVKLAESKIGSNKTYKDEINPTNEEKVITGYKVAKYSSNPLVITTDESKNVLTIYYEKDESQTKDIHYTIQYYKDNVLVTADTENYFSTIYVLDNITFTPNVNKYEGYEYDSVNSIIPNTIGDGQTIKVLYTTRKDLSYKVNYYEKGTNVVLQEPLQVINIPYNKVVKLEDVLKDIPGYNFAEADNSEITIGVNIELNVINVFYTKRTDLSYIVKYIDKETGEEIKNQKVVPQKLLGEVIDSKDEIINVDGYNYDSVEEDYLTIGASLNEMKIYYTKRNDIEYTIEYYFDDVLDSNLTKNIKAIYLQKIDEYKKAQRKGYTIDKEESFPLTISYIQEDNIIKIFYKRIVVPIRITSIDRITGRIIDYYEIGSRYGDEYIVNEKEFDGYNYVGTPSDIVGLTDTEVIDVTFYYEPLQNKSNSNNTNTNTNTNKNTNSNNSKNSVIKVQDTGLNVISYNIIIGVVFITIGITVLIIYTSKDKKNKETKAKF